MCCEFRYIWNLPRIFSNILWFSKKIRRTFKQSACTTLENSEQTCDHDDDDNHKKIGNYWNCSYLFKHFLDKRRTMEGGSTFQRNSSHFCRFGTVFIRRNTKWTIGRQQSRRWGWEQALTKRRKLKKTYYACPVRMGSRTTVLLFNAFGRKRDS